ncbi:MAG: PmoA family protein [Verrucomicrobia bacterium]|nr:PmoA family protein [Verrucomicrobiota bacterium]
MRLPRPLIAFATLATMASVAAADVILTRAEDRVRVEIGGQLFTAYIFQGAFRPYCYPILATDGTPLTRSFPMKSGLGEDEDHPHHRSLWFAHSDVNGVDFWNQDSAGSPRPKGKIIHDALLATSSGPVGVLRARSRWVSPDGKEFCTDETTWRFSGTADTRTIDFAITLRAPADAPVRLGDNKDGGLALRLATWLNLPAGATKRKYTGGVGHIVTAKGDREAAAWGKRAEWCDYHAAHDGKIYGIALFDHPQNLRHPTWWHAREYGLVSANPIGWHDFEARTTKAGAGDFTIPAGGSLTLRYQILFHFGNDKDAKIAERYAAFAATK